MDSGCLGSFLVSEPDQESQAVEAPSRPLSGLLWTLFGSSYRSKVPRLGIATSELHCLGSKPLAIKCEGGSSVGLRMFVYG